MAAQITASTGMTYFMLKYQILLLLTTTRKRNVRGMSRGIGLERLLLISKDGKLSVDFNEVAGQPLCINRSKLATECGVIIRAFVPLEYKSWTKIPLHDRETLMERVKDKFWVDLSVPYIWNFMHVSTGKRYNSYRGLMSKYFKESKFETIEEAKAMPYLGVSQDKWEWLCDHFSSDEFKKRSLAGSSNREKVQYNHCSGSMAFAVRHEMKKQLGDHSSIQVFYETHTKVIDKATKERIWLSDETRSRYDKMIELKWQCMEEGSEPRDEEDICVEVLGKKRKRRHVIAMQSNEETEELREKVRKQDEQIKQLKEDQASFRQDMLNRLGPVL
ncbi:hypothetical protein MKX01_004804 [Papaver californicum]|nr:hypothetical protein MKX01_004804 [Papaver californicum]